MLKQSLATFSLLCSGLLSQFALAQITLAEDWSHWRGGNRNDVVSETSGWEEGGFSKGWPLAVSWTLKAGEGSSSPLVIGERVYTLGWEKGRDHLRCWNVVDGTELWSVSYECPRYGRLATGDQGLYSGPSSTPEFDEATGLLYTLSTDGDLRCWDTKLEGKEVWALNLYESFDVPRRPKVGRSGLRDYGYTSSPLVHHDWLIVEVGAKEGCLAAFEKQTGKTIWLSDDKSPAGHNGGPTPITVEGVPCVALHNHNGLLVTRLDAGHEGETVATFPWITTFANNIATATVHENSVLMTSAYNQYKISRLEISLQGAKEVWTQELASKVCSPVVYKGNVYWAWTKVFCLDYASGKLQWQGGKVGDQGSVIATADDRLLIWANRGDLTLVETAQRSPEAYKQLAAQRVLSSSDAWPHLVLANGRLLCKDRKGTVNCLQLAN